MSNNNTNTSFPHSYYYNEDTEVWHQYEADNILLSDSGLEKVKAADFFNISTSNLEHSKDYIYAKEQVTS